MSKDQVFKHHKRGGKDGIHYTEGAALITAVDLLETYVCPGDLCIHDRDMLENLKELAEAIKDDI